MLFENKKSGTELFRVTPEGEVERQGHVITHDEAAIAEVFREWVFRETGIKVRTERPFEPPEVPVEP